MNRILLVFVSLALGASPALAHVGAGSTASFAAGVAHPLGGLDHIAVMVAVGLWAALKGGRALWAWPAAFIGVMLIGGALGMAHVPVPFVEPGILASVVTLGLMVALAIDMPVAIGAIVIALFALLHGHAHGSEVAETMSGAEYMAGFALATATLHLTGIGAALGLERAHLRSVIRVAGAVCVLIGPACSPAFCKDLPMIPGELFIKDGEIELNAGRKTVTLTVANSGDRPIQVGSHYHFFETNPALKFDRKKARGMRLDIAAGTAVRFEPGQTREVTLVALAGKKTIYGFRGDVMGKL